MKGFAFWYHDNDIFVISDKPRKSRTLVREAFKKMGINPSDGMVEVYYDLIRRAECEVKTLLSGRQYYDIHGKGFGGWGSFLDEGKTMIIKL